MTDLHKDFPDSFDPNADNEFLRDESEFDLSNIDPKKLMSSPIDNRDMDFKRMELGSSD